MPYSKRICEKAENIIKERELRAEQDLERRKAEAERMIPEIAEINARIAQTSAELTKVILQRGKNYKENFERIKERNLQGQQMIKELLKSHNIPEDYLKPKYFCGICSDTGYDGVKRCKCYNELLSRLAVEELNSEANMPDCDFEHFSLEYYKGKTDDNGMDCYRKMSENLSVCKEYAELFSLDSPSLLFIGMTGLGKTHLSLAIAKEVAKKGFSAAYGSLLNYLRVIENEHFGRGKDPDSDTMQTLIDSDLLVLDDLGSEFRSGFYESTLYNIINSRMNLGRPTIISTNLSPAELQKNYNDRMISRIFGGFVTIMFVGEDIRMIKNLKG